MSVRQLLTVLLLIAQAVGCDVDRPLFDVPAQVTAGAA